MLVYTPEGVADVGVAEQELDVCIMFFDVSKMIDIAWLGMTISGHIQLFGNTASIQSTYHSD